MENFLTVRACAEKLGVSATAVHRLIHRGTLAASWAAGRLFVRRDRLDALMADSDYIKRTRRVVSVESVVGPDCDGGSVG